ncbi:MAG TPA: CAP domain-containing protein [Polyangiaceae bacterium]
MSVVRAAIGAGVFACAASACVAPGAGQSNGAKMGEALAFAAAAGVAQVAESVAEQNARNNAPVHHASGLGLSPACDNDGQYACVSARPSGSQPEPRPEMTSADARDYVLGYVNGVRKLNGAARLERAITLDDFAQAGSEELEQDHRPGKHWTEHAQELGARSAELQGSPTGEAPAGLQDQLASVLLQMTGEGPGGMHHDVLLRTEWRKLGVGIVQGDDKRTYFTVDFTN